MKRVLGLDVHAASCTLAVISQAGKRLTDFPIETNGHALVEAIRRIPGRKHLVFEEGIQSAWLYETLSPHVDEIVVAGIPESRGQKSDRRATAAGVHPEAETPVLVLPSPRKRYGSQSDFTRGRLDNAEADAWIAESEAHGEVRLAILPYGKLFERASVRE